MVEVGNTYENQLFFEWEGLSEKWIKKEDSFDKDFPSQPHIPKDKEGKENSLATHILEQVFELKVNEEDKSNYGSYVPGYDVKSRDAYQMIQLSLAVHLGDENSKMVECYADPTGIVRYYPIGETHSNLNPSVLYSLSTGTFKQKCDIVVVEGYDPPLKKYTGDVINMLTYYNEKKDAWNDSIYDVYEDSNGQAYKDDDTYPIYWIMSDRLGPQACDNYKEGYIEYKDIRTNDTTFLHNNEIIDYYEYEKVLSWLYTFKVPFFKQGVTTVDFRSHTPRYVDLPGFGKLHRRNWVPSATYMSDVCRADLVTEVDPELGVRIPGSNNPRFIGVTQIYVYGIQLKQMDVDEVSPDTDEEGVYYEPGSADFRVDVDTLMAEPKSLSQGEDYVIVKDSEGWYRVVFISNVNPLLVDKVGGLLTTTPIQEPNAEDSLSKDYKVGANITLDPVYIRVDRSSLWKDSNSLIPSDSLDDYDEDTVYKLRDGKTEVSENSVFKALIFPTGEGTSGYALLRKEGQSDLKDAGGNTLHAGKIVAVCEWDNPCIAIKDIDNQATKENLKKVEFEIYPIITKDPLPPLAYNGIVMDRSKTLQNLDPAVPEEFNLIAYNRLVVQMEPGDIKISLPFLDEDQCEKVSKFIYDLQNQIVESTTHICEPDAEPILGEMVDGKVINSIDYAYQDSSQYLISVQTGPTWQGTGGWDTSVYQNQTERLKLDGIVREVNEDNTKCMIELERIGFLECINGQAQPLEPGDVVTVEVFNNPVSL